ncbi:MAG: hypothetical protein NTY01_24420 [Verrucomicrobia bacterium]|nr:hypothetical protein [Verrucomicrobiota bacterium]
MSGRWASALLIAANLALNNAQGAEIVAGDGLALRLDDATGAVSGVAVSKRELPLLPGQAGGLTIREWRRAEAAAGATPVAYVDFQTALGWSPSAGVGLNANGAVAVERRSDGGADGSKNYVRLGANRKYGHGVRFERDLPVSAGRTYTISWQGRVPSRDATFIVYLRLFDAGGREITETATPPKGWAYSPFSKTHYQYPIAPTRPAAWERISRAYRVPEGACSLRVAVCLWRGEYVDADNLRVEDAGGAMPGNLTALTGPVVCAPDGRSAVQRVVSSALQLEVRLTYSSSPTGVRIAVEMRDTSHPPRERALEVSYRLPLQTAGWVWHDDIRRRRRIEAGATYSNDFGYEGHLVSRYPFSCVTDDATGLMLAMPMDCPAMERRYCRADTGFVHTVDVGLSPVTRQMGPGCARWSLLIGAVEHQWGFRAAAARYYRAFPEFFKKRTQREGAWLWPVHPDRIPQPEDFGLTYWEADSAKREVCAAARQKGIYSLQYIEPSGLRQWFPKLKKDDAMPSLAKCLAGLKNLADDANSKAVWNGGPQAEIAQAVLNSLPEQGDGTPPFQASNEYDVWAQWWFTNPSPYLPAPNRGRTCWTYEIAPTLGDADGVYVDSVGLLGGGIDIGNHRAEHLSAAQTPLAFGLDDAPRPCLPAASSYHVFLAWLAGELHGRGKLLMLNIGADPPAYRFFAHTGDVLGGEISSRWTAGGRRPWELETDAVSCLRRTYGFRKPTTNLMQDGNWNTPVPAVTHTEIEQYIKHHMFYGFYPAISTIGGEEKPGYANWKRYFNSPEQYDRDRDLFKKYIPVIRRLNAAGWEPVTHATASKDTVAIERFGAWDKGGVLFTLRNFGDKESSITVVVHAFALGMQPVAMERVVVRDAISGAVISKKSIMAGGRLEIALSLPTRDTAVVALERPVEEGIP